MSHASLIPAECLFPAADMIHDSSVACAWIRNINSSVVASKSSIAKRLRESGLFQKQCESLNKEIDELYDQPADLIAEKRLSTENAATFSDREVRGAVAVRSPVIDEKDWWE